MPPIQANKKVVEQSMENMQNFLYFNSLSMYQKEVYSTLLKMMMNW